MPYVNSKVKANFKSLYSLHTRLKQLENFSTRAGFWKEVYHPNGKLNSAELATILEFGANTEGEAGYIPPRPFIKDGAEDSLIELRSMFLSRFYNFLGGAGRKTSPRDTLHPMGKVMAKWIGQRILFNSYTRNAPLTIEIKGFDRPLYETGWLADHVQVKTRKKV